eukprot:TRINITY_DN9301_c0_g1_i1.p1 TRINITY_DN9301_c0_g1~~TRINITY_DN9301_c0_g1_i1.p1  ORF type:complete len:930 (+),score=218.14 TRINITY_DN9301_c0_g1_i1:2-2791(+)
MDTIKFEQKAQEFMQDMNSTEVNRKRTEFLDREHKLIQVTKQWKRLTRKALYHSRGPWTLQEEAVESKLKWKLDPCENSVRMRRRLKRNYEFDEHQGCAIEQISSTPTRLPTQSVEDAKKSLEKGGSLSKAPMALEEENSNPSLSQPEPEIVVPEWEKDYKQKILFRISKAELVQPMLITIGEIEITATHFYFLAHRSVKDIKSREEPATQLDNLPKKNRRWNLQSFRSVLRRRFLLQKTAFEVFCTNGKTYFFNTSTTEECEKLLKKIGQIRPGIDVNWRHPALRLKDTKLTEKWQKRQISNFEYLMGLNSIAGRTYNDLTQYPVFPWILSDYTSEQIDLRNPAVYRDLSKPVGALNPTRLEDILMRYEAFEDPLIPKFHYGSHYSNIGIVLYFLLRMEPFTTYNLELQEGHFDHTDRLFASIADTFNNCLINSADFKELIPEFFYLPEFLENSNGFYLGKDQNGQVLNDVKLPPWASSAEEFIRINRAALESDYVSEHLHEWVDLIFGYKQRDKAAEAANNLFFHLTYEGVVDLNSIDDPTTRQAIECQIVNFGQTPPQLFTKPHVKRLSVEDCFPFKKQISLMPQKAIMFSTQSDTPIIFIGKANNAIVILHKNGVFTECTFTKFPDAARSTPFTFGIPTLANKKQPKETSELLIADNSQQALSTYFDISSDGKTILSCGHWDNSIKLISTANGEVVGNITKQNGHVSGLTLGEDYNTMATGSEDTTVAIWNLSQVMKDISQGKKPKESQVLCGHDNLVTCVSVNVDLDIVVSGSLDRTCIIHTLGGIYVRSIELEGAVRLVKIAGDGIYIVYDNEEDQTDSVEEPDEKDSPSCLAHYTINGKLVKSVRDAQVINVLLVSKDGKFVITSGEQHCISVRNAKLELVHVYYSKAAVTCITFVGDEEFLMAGLENGNVAIYPFDSSRWS